MKKFIGGFALSLMVLVGISFGLSSCLDSNTQQDPNVQLGKDIQAIDDYLANNNLDAVKNLSGIRMVISQLGTGFPARQYSSIDVDYIGTLFSNGTVFDQGHIKGAVTDYIAGWQDAFETLPAGSVATLYIPSYWGYGTVANNAIPANSILVFDVVFNSVVTTTAELQKLAADTVVIDTYLNDNAITAVKDTTGLRYVITELGTGPIPTWYDQVKFKSVYRLLTDDSNFVAQLDSAPDENDLNRVIDQVTNGLKLGLQRMPVGSKATLYLPSGLAFGTQGAGSNGQQIIPPDANIIIEVELTELVQ